MDDQQDNALPQAPAQVGKEQAAHMLGISGTTLDRWIKRGHIKPIRMPSGRRRFAVEEIRRVLDKMNEG
jgi:excisionase family DNA binding protein